MMEPISIVIPTYRRSEIVLASIRMLFQQLREDDEILIVDQTETHPPEVAQALAALQRDPRFRWLRREIPAIAPAMNEGLRESRSPRVLFLDDDIVPGDALLDAHRHAFSEERVWAVAGQVLQPGETAGVPSQRYRERGFFAHLDFPFRSTRPAEITNVMAGNLCVRRARALAIGGFDEAFVGSAYRFETDFARRLVAAGGVIRFEPRASIRHLRAPSGGTRKQGDHLCSPSPLHGMGDYYFAMKQGLSWGSLWHILRRPFREVATRHHLRHPHCIPIKLWGELRAIAMAWRNYRRCRIGGRRSA